RLQRGRRDVADVGLAQAEEAHLLAVFVVTHDREAGPRELDNERQADVPDANDDDASASALDLLHQPVHGNLQSVLVLGCSGPGDAFRKMPVRPRQTSTLPSKIERGPPSKRNAASSLPTRSTKIAIPLATSSTSRGAWASLHAA